MTKKELLKNIPADQWDKIKILNGLGEETGKIEQGKFASKEVFDSIILTNGDKEIEYEIIGEESEEVEKLGEQVESLSLKGAQPQGEVRNVLLIGKTGNGKSALGNVLINEFKNNEPFREVFKESFGSTSETKGISEETFEVPIDKEGDEKITYRIIDTIGLGDTTLTTQGVLVRLSKVAERVKKEGLNHILFVAGGRFTKEEIEAYDLLKSVIFEEKVVKHTTIVRTRFDEFEDKEACDEDRSKLREQNPEIANILMEVNIIYVDNPPLKGSKKKIDANKEERLKSREKVIKYLVCKPGNYRPENIDTLEKRVNEYQTNEQLLKNKMEELAEERKKAEEEFRETLKNMTEEQAKIMRENDERIQDLMHNQELELKEISRQAEERERKAKQEAEAREQRMRQEISEIKKVAENQERLMKQEAERLRAEAQAKERQIKNEEGRIEKMLQEQQLQGEKRLELEREKHAAEIKAQEANREIERLKYEAQIKDQEAQDAMYEAEERERDLQAQIRQEQDKSALDKFVSFKWF